MKHSKYYMTALEMLTITEEYMSRSLNRKPYDILSYVVKIEKNHIRCFSDFSSKKPYPQKESSGKNVKRYYYTYRNDTDSKRSANGPKDYCKRLLELQKPESFSVQIALHYLKYLYGMDANIIVFDWDGKTHSFTDDNIENKLLQFLMKGPEEPQLFSLSEKNKNHLRQLVSTWTSQKEDSNDPHRHRRLLVDDLASETDWIFNLRECHHPAAFITWLCDSSEKNGCRIINDALLTRIHDVRFGYSTMFHSSESTDIISFLQPQTIINITEEPDERPKHPPHFSAHIHMDPGMLTDLSKFERRIRGELSDTPYTMTDVYDILGEYAMANSQGSDANRPLSLLPEDIDPSGFRGGLLQHIQDLGIISLTEKSLRFSRSSQRIIFRAIHRAELDRQLACAVTPYEHAEILRKYPNTERYYLENFGIGYYKQDKELAFRENHIYVSFNWAAVYYCTYARALERTSRDAMLMVLKRYASDFNTDYDSNNYNRRILQIKALTILSYYLLSNDRLPASEEKDIFRICYAENWYPIQTMLIHRLLELRPYYKRLLRDEFRRSCQLDDDGYASSQPYYILMQSLVYDTDTASNSNSHLNSNSNAFLPAELPGENRAFRKWSEEFFQCAIRFHKKTWGATNTDQEISELTHALQAIQSAGGYLNDLAASEQIRPADNSALLLVYGLQFYSYAFADILGLKRKLSQRLQAQLTDPTIGPIVIRTFILTDYYTRCTNRLFDRGTYGPENDMSPDRMFLLCGPERFFCAAVVCKIVGSCPLSSRISQDYRQWLGLLMKRRPRHAYLLLRLLAYTDFQYDYTDEENLYNKITFLPYDNMPLSYQDFIEESRKL